MASGGDDALRVVEVKHGKDRHEIAVDDGSITTARDLMDRLLDITGVLQKNQKLLAKGKVLEADVPLASQMKPKGGRATVMLMASAGGGGGNAPKMTAGEAALAASRAAKAAKLADARKDGLEAMVTNEDRTRARKAREAFAATETARKAAWGKTGVVGLREAGLDEVPREVWDLGACPLNLHSCTSVAALTQNYLLTNALRTHVAGSTARVVDLHRNRIATLPAPKLATLTGITKLRLSGNVVTALDEFWNSLASLPALTTLCLEDNEIAALPTIEPGHFAKLETLSLDRNALAVLPDSFGLHMSALERLGLSGNRLASLPASLASCARLDRIDARRNTIESIPGAYAGMPRLRSLLLDGNRVGKGGIPVGLLTECVNLCELSLHDNAVSMEELRELDGWTAYDTRRKERAGKVLESRVMLGDRAFDEGGDVERFRRH